MDGDSRSSSLLDTLLPWRLHDISVSSERHAYINNLLDSRIGGLLNWLPFILVVALACKDVRAAVWSAFGVQMFMILVKLYQFSANKRLSPVMWLDAGLALSLLCQGVVAEVETLPCDIVSPINVSVLLASALVSMLATSPFTMQFARLKPEVTDEVLASAAFLKLNYLLTFVWVILFALMSLSSWLGWAFFRDDTDSTGHIILSTVVPILLPVLGSQAMPCLVAWLRQRAANSPEYEPPVTEADAQQQRAERPTGSIPSSMQQV